MNSNNERISHRKGLLAISPVAVFLVTYLLTSIAVGDFYTVPVSSAFLVAAIYAFLTSRGSVKEKTDIFSKGAGDGNVLLMVWIFILAGAFAGTAKDIGAIDATVGATLRIVPPGLLLAGLFLTACFISMSIGTSVGTIVALMPIASGIACQCGVLPGQMAAVIVGGSFFGDNLSFISDTTIASTRAAGCEMKDKFKVNILIILPALAAVTAIYIFQGQCISVQSQVEEINLLKIVPYILVILMALLGFNVTGILACGIGANAVLGFACGDFSWSGWLASAGAGIAGMSDLIIITLIAGGLLALIRENGGLDYIIQLLTRHIHGKRGAELSIAGLVSVANLCTANNTIAIITTGGIAKDITDKFGIDPRKTASILDTFSCLVQGIIPYGAQLLMASGLAACSPTAIIPYLYYPFIMGLCAIGAILFRLPRRYS